MATVREATAQERADEAQLDNELAAAAERAATTIQERDKTIEGQTRRISELESHDAEAVGVITEGSAARSERMARKRRALEMLKKAGVVAVVLAALSLAWKYPYAPRIEPTQLASQVQEAPPAGFLLRSAV